MHVSQCAVCLRLSRPGTNQLPLITPQIPGDIYGQRAERGSHQPWKQVWDPDPEHCEDRGSSWASDEPILVWGLPTLAWGVV